MTLADKVTETLTRLIRSGETPPGSRLPSENDMAGRFGVSRTVVREAVSRLKSEGLVESHQGKGVFVRLESALVPFRLQRGAPGSVRSVLHIVELRKGIEAEAAALAAAHRTDANLREIRRALRRLDRVVHGGEGGVKADQAFHRAIARATGNPHFLDLSDFIGQFLAKALRLTRAYEARRAELVAQVRREHAAIAEAIERNDIEGARTAARRHLEMVAIRFASAEGGVWGTGRGRPEREDGAAARAPGRQGSRPRSRHHR